MKEAAQLILNSDGTLADCEARRILNQTWANWPTPEVFSLELKALFTEHPTWQTDNAVQVYIAKLLSQTNGTSEPDILGNGFAPTLRTMSDIEAEMVRWLWKPYIPFGKLTLLEGDPGVGKSWLSLAIVTAVSLGQGLPGLSSVSNGPCLLASVEDGLADTIKPRLSAMGADTSIIKAIDGLLTLDQNGFEWLERQILEAFVPSLLVIDPLQGYLSGDMDINKANQARFATARLAHLAETYGMAILAIRHLTKGGSLKPIYRGLGSIDFTAAARSVLLAGADPDMPQIRAFTHIKSNLELPGEPVGYEIRDGKFFWLAHTELTTERILAGNSSDSDKSALTTASEFLIALLTEGDLPAKEVFAEAKAAGITEATLNRAKGKLNITTYRTGEKGREGGGKFMWKLPQNC